MSIKTHLQAIQSGSEKVTGQRDHIKLEDGVYKTKQQKDGQSIWVTQEQIENCDRKYLYHMPQGDNLNLSCADYHFDKNDKMVPTRKDSVDISNMTVAPIVNGEISVGYTEDGDELVAERTYYRDGVEELGMKFKNSKAGIRGSSPVVFDSKTYEAYDWDEYWHGVEKRSTGK